MHIHMRLIISSGSPFTDCYDRLNPGYSQGGGSVTLSSTWFIIDLYTNVNHFQLWIQPHHVPDSLNYPYIHLVILYYLRWINFKIRATFQLWRPTLSLQNKTKPLNIITYILLKTQKLNLNIWIIIYNLFFSKENTENYGEWRLKIDQGGRLGAAYLSIYICRTTFVFVLWRNHVIANKKLPTSLW